MSTFLNSIITFITLVFVTFLVATNQESGDKSAAGMYLAFMIIPIILITGFNSFVLLLTKKATPGNRLNIYSIITTPLILTGFTLELGSLFGYVNYYFIISIVLTNFATELISFRQRKNTGA
jgi:hypothetical protein